MIKLASIAEIIQRRAFAFRWGVSIGLTALLFVRLDMSSAWESIKVVPLWYFPTALSVLILSLFVSSWKWVQLYRDQSLMKTFFISMVANFYAVVMPSSISGDAARLVIAGRGTGRLPETFATVLLDKLIGVFCVVSLTTSASVLHVNEKLRQFWLPSITILVLIVIALLITTTSWTATLGRLGHKSIGLGTFRIGAAELIRVQNELQKSWKKPQRIIASVILGFSFQALIALFYTTAGIAVELDLTFADYVIASGVAQIAILLPLSIAGIGVKDVALVGIIVLLGGSYERAVLVSIISYPVIATIAVCGLLFRDNNFTREL